MILKKEYDKLIAVFWNLILQIIAGIVGLFLAQRYVPGVDFKGDIFFLPTKVGELREFFRTLVFVGALLGFLNHFIKPSLKAITLPLRVITFNLFSVVILMFLVWLVDIFSPELIISGLRALFFTSIIVWAVYFLLNKWLPSKKLSK